MSEIERDRLCPWLLPGKSSVRGLKPADWEEGRTTSMSELGAGYEKSHIRETLNLSTDADLRSDTKNTQKKHLYMF